MHEIKFRAWDQDEQMMLTSFNVFQEDDNGFHAGYKNSLGDWVTLELMQFTGLKDKNGKEIYEGDIVRRRATEDGNGYEKGDITVEGVVCYVAPAFILHRGISFRIRTDMPDDLEVIGNIHENPKLLKL